MIKRHLYVCITKEEKLIVEDVELKIFIVNVKTRQVESIFTNNQDMGISPFIVDYEHSVLFFSPYKFMIKIKTL